MDLGQTTVRGPDPEPPGSPEAEPSRRGAGVPYAAPTELNVSLCTFLPSDIRQPDIICPLGPLFYAKLTYDNSGTQ